MAVALEHFIHKVQKTVASGLSSGQAAAVGQTLTGEDTFINAPDALILAVHEADFPGAHADIASGHVGIRADVLIQLSNQALAEGHDFPVGFALGVKVGAALAAADGQAGEGILEGLLEGQELHDGKIHGGVEAHATLVGSDGGVKLDPVGIIHLDLTVVIHPGNPEQDAPLGGGQSLQQGVAAVGSLVGFDDHPQRFQNLIDCLIEFRLVGILLFYPCQYLINIAHKQMSSLGRKIMWVL